MGEMEVEGWDAAADGVGQREGRGESNVQLQ